MNLEVKIISRKYWIGVASLNHINLGIAGGFAQVCHGKERPLKRMKKDDWIIYYSPKISLEEAEVYRKFTAIGKVLDDEVYQFQMAEDFIPFRRNVRFAENIEHISIYDLLDDLEFIDDKTHYGNKFRFGHFEISEKDFVTIGRRMGALKK
ncbi:MAG: EVE domain-containing protein [Fusobacteriaceae bacterium]